MSSKERYYGMKIAEVLKVLLIMSEVENRDANEDNK
jgi:hypothetical protein